MLVSQSERAKASAQGVWHVTLDGVVEFPECAWDGPLWSFTSPHCGICWVIIPTQHLCCCVVRIIVLALTKLSLVSLENIFKIMMQQWQRCTSNSSTYILVTSWTIIRHNKTLVGIIQSMVGIRARSGRRFSMYSSGVASPSSVQNQYYDIIALVKTLKPTFLLFYLTLTSIYSIHLSFFCTA